MSKEDRKKLHKYLKKNEKKLSKLKVQIQEELEEGEELNMTDNEFKDMKNNEEQIEGYESYKGKKNNPWKKITAIALAIALCGGLTKCAYDKQKKNIKDFDLSGLDKSISEGISSNIKIPEIKLPIVEEDTIAPILQVEYSTKELAESVEAIIKANEEVQAVDGWTLLEDNKSLSKTFIENVDENVTVKDLAGNESVANIKISNIKTIDNTFKTPTVSYSTKAATNGNVQVTISSTKEMKEVSGWKLSKDKKSMTKTYTENKTEKVTVSDLEGNKQTVNVEVKNIDRTFKTPTVSYSTKELTNGSVLVTITSNEQIEPVSGWVLSLDKKSLTKNYNNNIEETITIKDLAGNMQDVDIKINNIDRVFNILNVNYNPEYLTNGNVTVTITSDEQMKEVSGWKLSEDKKSLTKTYTENIEEEVIVSDLAGNTKNVKVVVKHIDREFDKVSVDYKSKGGNKEVIITSNEKMQPLKGWTLSEDGKTLTKVYSDNKTEKITISDLAGNEQTVEIKVTGISYSSSDDNSYTPSNPGGGDKPDQPDNPDQPDKPDKPTEPDKPSEPETPSTDDNGKDIYENPGSGGVESDDKVDDDFFSRATTKDELEQLYVMKETLETIKIDGLEFEYPVRKLSL